LDKDFEIFYREDPENSPTPTHHHLATAQVSISQEATNIPKAMVLEEKTLDLLALLTTHVGGNSPVVPKNPRLPTLALAQAIKKKRKKGKATEGSKEGEIP